uniref:Uncharacterized protein n=1 Tax=Heterorhabditis bacteriophora TaxID=37862 RepID=A0A1I7WG81_HETBA
MEILAVVEDYLLALFVGAQTIYLSGHSQAIGRCARPTEESCRRTATERQEGDNSQSEEAHY